MKKVVDAKSTTFVNDQDIIMVDSKIISMLKREAMTDPLKRARFCLHMNNLDTVHQMIIVHHKDTYVRPHKHINKIESFHIIEGILDIIFFNNSGDIVKAITLSSNPNKSFIYRLSSSKWHMVIPKTRFVVFHEITAGPFVKDDCIFPDWAPSESESDKIDEFKKKMKLLRKEYQDDQESPSK